MEIRGIASWCEQIPETSCKNCFKRDGEEESKYCLPRLLSEHDRSDVWIISLWWSNNVYAYPVMWPSCIVWWPRLFSADAPNLKAANKESFPFFNQVNHQLIQITQNRDCIDVSFYSWAMPNPVHHLWPNVIQNECNMDCVRTCWGLPTVRVSPCHWM